MFRFILILLFTSSIAHAQPSDFIILKKKNKTIHSYFQGTQIEFVTNRNVYKNAVITKIENDTIFLREFLVNQMVTNLGYYITDTAGSFSYAYDYRDIKIIGKKEKGFNIKNSGSALFGGGILLTLASGVSYLVDRKKFSPELLGASVALGGIGYLMTKVGGKGIIIGKKHYRLEYVKLSPEKK